MYLESILGLIISSVLRKSLETKTNLPQWDKVLLIIMYASIGLLVWSMLSRRNGNLIMCLGHLLVFYLVYIVFKNKEFRFSKPFIYSLLPLIIISFVDNIAQWVSADFYNKWNSFFDAAMTFAYVWVGAMWIITKRQRKALENERIKTQELEKEFKLNEKIKAALEVQVAERTASLTLQKEELEHTLVELKATQTQLIQSEKMASLGELTAGIAHEIQNPLNFVNNFSEVNKELLEEMQGEIAKGNFEEVRALASDIISNEEKINHHGKRADGIVKSMLQHSRVSNGVYEPTDINALADEYLRLAYHGLRAKDKSFNATLNTDYDEFIGRINVIPQDIGRVILNLITNAFYAAAHSSHTSNGVTNGPQNSHEPTIWIKTSKMSDPENSIQISVRDNGPGIPQNILDKIFQPFFTTKPTGQGTGLGLSLSYDIVKAHGGELNVVTKEGEGTEFIITLPT